MNNYHYANSITKQEWLEKNYTAWDPNRLNCPPGQNCSTVGNKKPCSECYFKSRAKGRYRDRFQRFVREEVVRRFPHIEQEPYEARTNFDVDNEVAKTKADAVAHVDERLKAGENPEIIYQSEPEDSNKGWEEGQLVTRVKNITRRNKTARKDKIAHVRANNQGHLVCEGCGEDMGRDDRVEVHHENPLQYQQSTYQLDPINDLAVYCGNCHGLVTRVEQATRTNGSTGVNLSRKQLRQLYALYRGSKNGRELVGVNIRSLYQNNPDTINFFRSL